MENLELYDKLRCVPDEAKKEIKGGKLSGKTDINPMWRIKKLTETYGPAGIGWYYDIVEKRLDNGPSGEIAAFVQINLYVRIGSDWSKPITGIGGSSFVAMEKGKLAISDECFKMALTDAISVSCKALGMGADVYWSADLTKYDKPKPEEKPKQNFSYDLVTERFIEKVAKAEADAAASGEHFSLLGFLERYYYVTGDQAGIVQEKLNNYKQTHKSA